MIQALLMLIVALIVLCVVFYKTSAANEREKEQQLKLIYDLIQSWQTERKELMDRVQAGSFAEYKQGEIRTIKAQKKEETPAPTYHLE